MPLLIAGLGLLALGVLSASIEWRDAGIRIPRGWVVAELLAIPVLGGIVLKIVLDSIT